MKGGKLRRGGFWLKGAPANATVVHTTADARTVVAGYPDGSIYSWPLTSDARSRRPEVVAGAGVPVGSMTSSGDGTHLLVGYRTGQLNSFGRRGTHRWGLTGGVHEHQGEVFRLLVLRASPWVLSASSDGTLRRWTLDASGKFLRGTALSRHAGQVAGTPKIIEVDAKDSQIALLTRQGSEQRVHLRSLSSTKNGMADFEVPGVEVTALRINPGRAEIVIGRDDGRIQLLSAERPDEPRLMFQEESRVRLLADSPTPDWFLSANATGQLHLRHYQLAPGHAQVAKEALLARFASPISEVDVSSTSGVVVAQSVDGLLGAWRVSARGYRDVEAPLNTGQPSSSVSIDSSGDWLAVVRRGGTVDLWRRERHSFHQVEFENPTKKVVGAVWDAQRHVLVLDMGRHGIIAYEPAIRGWEAVARTTEKTSIRSEQITSFSGGRRIVSLSAAGEVLLWLRVGEKVFRPVDLVAPAGHLFAFSRMGLVSVGPGGGLREWRIDAGEGSRSCPAQGRAGCAAALNQRILRQAQAGRWSLEQEVSHEGGLTHFRDI